MTIRSSLKIKIQLCCGDEIAMGPGKADLLDAIMRVGSILGGARDGAQLSTGMDAGGYNEPVLASSVGRNYCWRRR